jgi:hypothetical protein
MIEPEFERDGLLLQQPGVLIFAAADQTPQHQEKIDDWSPLLVPPRVPRHAISWERVSSMTSYLVEIGTWATVYVMCQVHGPGLNG